MIFALEGGVAFSRRKRHFLDEHAMQILVGPVQREDGADQPIDALFERNSVILVPPVGKNSQYLVEMSHPYGLGNRKIVRKILVE